MADQLHTYGNVLSPPSRSLESFAKLSGIEFTHHDIYVLTGEHLSEEFTRINPFQTIPAISHNGVSFWESAAIVSYLAEAYNIDNSWFPRDIKIRARINSYLHWHHQNVREPIGGYLIAKLIGPKFFGAPELTEETEAPYREKYTQFFETFKWLLSSTGYVARTEGPTIADIFAFNEVSSSMLLGVNLDSHPEIKKWFLEIARIPVVHEFNQEAEETLKKFT